MREKTAILLSVCLLLLLAAGVRWHLLRARQLADAQRANTARLLVDQAMLVKHWEKFEEGDHFALYLQYFQEGLSQQEHDWRFIAGRPTEDTRAGPQDDFEKELLARWLTAPPEDSPEADRGDSAQRLASDGKEYQYYQAVRAEKSCISVCHKAPPAMETPLKPDDALAMATGAEPLAEGDLMGIVQVTFPTP
jgi:hypothetical protein